MNAINLRRLSYLFAPAAAIAFTPMPSAATSNSGNLVDRGIATYYAVIPAGMIRGHSKEHPRGRCMAESPTVRIHDT